MLFSKKMDTQFGTLQLCCDGHGLARIYLPGRDINSGITEARKSPCVPAVLELAAQQLKEYFSGKRTCFELPISLHGTEFQQHVWRIISRIPYGQTMSYGEIASKLGSRTKARAVGGAANANPLPLVIPCHRVIGTKGALTGYAGGVKLKKYLLDLENKISTEQECE